ncbi:Uncharacterised protein [Moraxella lacunata]|uniref:Periplasmic protein n=1 Tax=Moraxella lacunata TaxID=477 RepID=A0A378T5U3_MORLA|nr:hypothetical protein [Moraxella lacunata]STZ56191.1 Uncharacterised protein [Moraxella lacunata]
MKALIIIAFFMLLPNTSFAYENPDQKATCYLFKNNKLQKKSACLMQTGGGAGGMYAILTFNNKKYHFETETMTGNYEITYYPNNNLNKPTSVAPYYRDQKTLKILTQKESESRENLLACRKTKDSTLDFCYRSY